MAATKLPPQINQVRKGMWLKFIRPVQDGNVYLNKASGPSGREIYVLEDAGIRASGRVLVAFKTRIRSVFGSPVEMHYVKGLRYCWLVPVDTLINNCKEVT